MKKQVKPQTIFFFELNKDKKYPQERKPNDLHTMVWLSETKKWSLSSCVQNKEKNNPYKLINGLDKVNCLKHKNYLKVFCQM